jgi:hypothetical protein
MDNRADREESAGTFGVLFPAVSTSWKGLWLANLTPADLEGRSCVPEMA